MAGYTNKDVCFQDRKGKVTFNAPVIGRCYNIALERPVRVVVKKALILKSIVVISEVIRYIEPMKGYNLYCLN